MGSHRAEPSGNGDHVADQRVDQHDEAEDWDGDLGADGGLAAREEHQPRGAEGGEDVGAPQCQEPPWPAA